MTPSTITIKTPAKVNLFLQVVARRADHYHDLFSLMCPISLYDTVLIDFKSDESTVSVSCAHPQVPEDERNLVVQAAVRYLKHVKRDKGLAITIHKEIPVAAGLGGGSSDAAAVLSGLNRYFGHPVSLDQLIDIGLAVGADVPFFIVKKPALATGVGEKLELYDELDPFHILLMNPGYDVSTARIFKNLNLRLTKCQKLLKDFSFKKRGFDPTQHLCNDLETVTVSFHPDIEQAKTALLDHGAKGALMSGSGPTVFGLFDDVQTMETAAGNIGKRLPAWRLYRAALLI